MPEPKANPVVERLRWYWQMEAGNALLVPAATAGLVLWAGDTLDLAFGIAVIACAALLVIGALYWRAALRKIEGDPKPLAFWLPRLAWLEAPSIALVAAAMVALLVDVLIFNGGWGPTNIATAVLTLLAALEYVNYYKVQLQHFDHAADMQRLLLGRGFRKAHMARDIAAWRARNAANTRS
ncbi:MAG TPA: hypothetical protein VM915_10150 [Verrucomicrobiae bacterium]|nr:hypothetical protein [Verrucomicrobiae bacterium]